MDLGVGPPDVFSFLMPSDDGVLMLGVRSSEGRLKEEPKATRRVLSWVTDMWLAVF